MSVTYEIKRKPLQAVIIFITTLYSTLCFLLYIFSSISSSPLFSSFNRFLIFCYCFFILTLRLRLVFVQNILLQVYFISHEHFVTFCSNNAWPCGCCFYIHHFPTAYYPDAEYIHIFIFNEVFSLLLCFITVLFCWVLNSFKNWGYIFHNFT